MMQICRFTLLGSLALALAACATTGSQPIPTPKTVTVVVTAKCDPQMTAPPDYPDTDALLMAAPDLFTRVRALAAGRVLRIARERELNAALDACKG